MWEALAAVIRANATQTLVISIIGTALVWMYKQFKGMMDKEQQERLATAQLKQGLFTKLELSIASVLHLNNEESKQRMYALLGECGPYLSRTQRDVMRDYYKSFDPALLLTLQALTVSEVDKLSREVEKMLDYRDGIEWLKYIQRLYAPFWPILLFVTILLFILYLISFAIQRNSLWMIINVILCGAALAVSITFGFIIIHFLAKRQLAKQGVKRWGAVLLVVISPFFIVAMNWIDFSIVVVGVQALMIGYLFWGKRPVEIVRLS